MFYINEDGVVYEFAGTVEEQTAKYPMDDHSPYALKADAEAEVDRIEALMNDDYAGPDDRFNEVDEFGCGTWVD